MLALGCVYTLTVNSK